MPEFESLTEFFTDFDFLDELDQGGDEGAQANSPRVSSPPGTPKEPASPTVRSPGGRVCKAKQNQKKTKKNTRKQRKNLII